MKITSLFLFYLLASGKPSPAQLFQRAPGLGAYSLKQADIFSVEINPAALTQLKNISAGIYGERKFLLKELNNYKVVAGWPTHSGNFGLKAGYAGFSEYNETEAGIAYGRKLGSKVDIGACFNYQAMRISGYGNASAIGFDLGTLLHITNQLHAGIHISNPVGGKFGEDYQLPSVYTVGLGYDASEKFFVAVEIEKVEDLPVNINGGFLYKVIPQLLVKFCISPATSLAWISVGLTIKSFRVEMVSSYHPQLGITPGLLMLFNLGGMASRESQVGNGK